MIDARDHAAVEAFYRAHARVVLRWVIRLGGPDLDAEDVAHDVFGVAMRRIGTFRSDSGSAEAWLWGITRRVVANARRRARLRRFIGLHLIPSIDSAEIGADRRVEQLRLRRLVQSVLDGLSDDHREVMVLVDLDERSAPEVAAMLGISVGTVYSRLHYARKRFGERLGSHRTALDHAALRDAVLGGDDR